MTSFFEWRQAPAADYAVIGDPIVHSRSPQMHAAAYRALGLDLKCVAVRVPSGEAVEALDHLKRLGYRGINVTVPLKEEVASRLSRLDEFSARCGAVNTVDLIESKGVNTDGPGFIDTLEGRFSPGSNALVLGAGGSARAIALALALAGYNLRVYNRTPERAHALLSELRLSGAVVDEPVAKDADLIVNATAASLAQVSLPIVWQGARDGALAYDLVYGESAFLREASRAGLATQDGRELLVAQGARSFEFWLGMPAPREAMREAAQ